MRKRNRKEEAAIAGKELHRTVYRTKEKVRGICSSLARVTNGSLCRLLRPLSFFICLHDLQKEIESSLYIYVLIMPKFSALPSSKKYDTLHRVLGKKHP